LKHLNSTLGLAPRQAPPLFSAGREELSLDGAWQLAFDPDNRGSAEKWHAAFPAAQAIEASVPAVWELVRPGYDGVAWYRRNFELPPAWAGRTLRLRFGAAQYHAEVWLNGERLGDHEGGFLPFEFDVSSRARVGANTVIVRVLNPPMDREIDGFRCGAPLNQGPIPIGKAGWYYNFGGLWQSVSLIATDGLSITRITPEPSLAREEVFVKVMLDLAGAPGRHEIECEITGADGKPVGRRLRVRRGLRAGVNQVCLRVPLRRARPWSPEDPYLHSVRVTVRRDGQGCDTHSVRFGMREFTVRAGRFELNGRPVMLKGFLHQGSYPRTLARPQDRDFAERELRAVKAHGFNFVRAHLQPALPEWLDLCDELGLLVMAEPPIGWIERTPEAEARCWREIQGLVERDAHHASVVVWCLMNEVFHLRGFAPQVVLRMTAKWLERLRKIDATRPCIDVSGGHGMTQGGGAEDMLPDTASQGRTSLMTVPDRVGFEPVLDAHIYHDFPPPAKTLRTFREVGGEGPLFFISEYGAPPVPPLFDEVVRAYSSAERKSGLEDLRLHAGFGESLRAQFRHPALSRACGSPRAFIEECNRLRAEEVYEITTALRSNPRVAGYCFCQLADASGELFGALDTWRRPKPLMEALGQAADAGALGVFATPRVAAPGDWVEIELVWLGGATEKADGRKAEWALTLENEEGEVALRWSGQFRPVADSPRVLLKKRTKAPRQPGAWRWRASGRAGGLELHGRLDARVLAKPVKLGGSAIVGGTESPLAAALTGLGLSVEPFGNNCREADRPIFLDWSRVCASRQLWFEELGQLRKLLQVGGCAVVFEPEMSLVREVIPEAATRMQPIMRSIGYAADSVIFGGLPCGRLMDFNWAELPVEKFDRAEDVAALGGEVYAGALSFNMWTRPAVFFHGASLYSLPVGKGRLIVCHIKLLPALAAGLPEARSLLAGIVSFAGSFIRSPDTKRLLSRCIDPFSEVTPKDSGLGVRASSPPVPGA
jgi:beta-galactosidase